MAKVAIVGATGKVGQYAALSISRIPYVNEIQLYGRPGSEGVLEGIARDLIDSFAATGTDTRVSWSCSIEDLQGSDIIIFTAGSPRQAHQTRNDLALGNAHIVKDFAEKINAIAPESLLLMITNPVDIMTHVALKYSGKKPNEVFGIGTHLDSMRLKSAIASFFKVHVSEVHTRIIGEHGESMVPLWSATTVGGIQISNLPSFANVPIDEIMTQVKCSGQRIIASKGATVWGPGEAIGTLVRTIPGNENRILTVSAYIRAEVHNIGDVCIGVPVRINRTGVYPVPIRIEPPEVTNFRISVEKIRTITKEVFDALDNGE
ncbi:MAG TPA: malate dehydrogenase [Methanospirillum sp.]|nr:malate dehydrogenase [Methanospirillum sp.]